MTCTHCGSENIRTSRKEGRNSTVSFWRHGVRYRCRSCRRSFYLRLSAEDRAALKKSDKIRHKRRGSWNVFSQSRSKRVVLQLTLFIGMLLVFYVTFTRLISRDGSGFLTAPPPTPQDWP
jgi:hypothetical protein